MARELLDLLSLVILVDVFQCGDDVAARTATNTCDADDLCVEYWSIKITSKIFQNLNYIVRVRRCILINICESSSCIVVFDGFPTRIT